VIVGFLPVIVKMIEIEQEEQRRPGFGYLGHFWFFLIQQEAAAKGAGGTTGGDEHNMPGQHQ
jgi:hypothetical protein